MASTVTGRPRVALRRWISASARKTLGISLLAIALGGCRQSPRDPVTLSYFRLGWSQPDELPTANPLERQFTQKTGIRLKNLPVPETTLDQLDLSRKLLESGSGPDVLGIDLIWSGVLERDLIDLRPYLTTEISSLEPQLLPSYTVDGKVVAIPYTVQMGVLEYRTDLLHEYGYDHPPKTWDELEGMATRVQAGERGKGKKDFWGYVWQGADAEALTCNALEWQVAEGGGRIIEDDRTISVNNPAAIRAWQRAKRWIGWISPPSVVAYRELDTINVFDSGGAAFNRVWGGATITRGGTISPNSLAKIAAGWQGRVCEYSSWAWRVGWHAGRFRPGSFTTFRSSSRSHRACPVSDSGANPLERGGGGCLRQPARTPRSAIGLGFAQSVCEVESAEERCSQPAVQRNRRQIRASCQSLHGHCPFGVDWAEKCAGSCVRAGKRTRQNNRFPYRPAQRGELDRASF